MPPIGVTPDERSFVVLLPGWLGYNILHGAVLAGTILSFKIF